MPLGVYQANCYILINEGTHETVVIDPAGEFDKLEKYLIQEKCEVEYIILTHAHADHIGALSALKEKTMAPVCIHEGDVEALSNANLNLTVMMGKTKVEVVPDLILKDQQELVFGNNIIRILSTPGHTKGSACIYVEDRLFAGDTLFASSIGRTDLVGGSYDEIIESLKKLVTLPNETQVFPGHGPSTSIGKEKSYNPFLQF